MVERVDLKLQEVVPSRSYALNPLELCISATSESGHTPKPDTTHSIPLLLPVMPIPPHVSVITPNSGS